MIEFHPPYITVVTTLFLFLCVGFSLGAFCAEMAHTRDGAHWLLLLIPSLVGLFSIQLLMVLGPT